MQILGGTMNQIVNPIKNDVDLQNRRMMLAQALQAKAPGVQPVNIDPVDVNAFSKGLNKSFDPRYFMGNEPAQPTDTFTRPVQNRVEAEGIFGSPQSAYRNNMEAIYGKPTGQTPQQPNNPQPIDPMSYKSKSI